MNKNEERERAWRHLLGLIRVGEVIPVVGPQLLTIEAAEGTQSLQAIVAERVLRSYGRSLPDDGLPRFRELNEAVMMLEGVNSQELYNEVHEAIRGLADTTDQYFPVAIDQLARISDFRLFVTLTPDDLLAQALRKRGEVVSEVVHSTAASVAGDFRSDWIRDKVQLLYLFGKSCPTPQFAISDDDVLEYAHSMVIHGVPKQFFEVLRGKNLLLLGCNFPDWLSRLFLRLSSTVRLSSKSARDRREWLIEPVEAPLVTFLKAYSKSTVVLSDIRPVDFVAELHRRWLELTAREARTAPSTSPAIETPAAGTIFFVSYSRKTDRSRAEKLVQALRELGADESDLWFDRQDIEPGDDFGQRILDGIDSCRYFLPLVSEAADRRDEGFFFREWRAANKRKKGMNRPFVHPLIVDPDYEPERYKARPLRAWSRIHFGHAPDGVPDESTSSSLKELLREARRPGART